MILYLFKEMVDTNSYVNDIFTETKVVRNIDIFRCYIYFLNNFEDILL